MVNIVNVTTFAMSKDLKCLTKKPLDFWDFQRRSDLIRFLNDAAEILRQLDEKETELVNEANAALNAANGL